MAENKPLYLWKVLEDGTLEKNTILEYRVAPALRKRDQIRYRSNSGNISTTYVEDMDKFKHQRVYSWSDDYNYIWNIISKTLFDKMMDAASKSKKANDAYLNFRTKNKRE